MGDFSFEIRPATEADFEELAHLERAAAQRFLEVPEQTGMSYEQLQETLEPHELERALAEGGLWVAVVEERPAGFVATHRYPQSLYIRELDVLQEFGRRGIGRALVQRSFERAAELQLPTVFLRTFHEVPWNAPFYARLGFEVVPFEDWTDAMGEIVGIEEQWGLVAEKRVFMRRVLPLN